ncbi:lipopolysaccharide biosynthesis protein [Rhodopirellula bahusiensis]|uniref:lipopolysaccharide biosynthesis protein n=1 Tax=Rhodopirellula bahusiensis TaxID=2014065 RepID=UPI003265D1D7
MTSDRSSTDSPSTGESSIRGDRSDTTCENVATVGSTADSGCSAESGESESFGCPPSITNADAGLSIAGEATPSPAINGQQPSAEATEVSPPPSRFTKAFSFAQTVGFAFAIVALQMGQGILLARLLGPVGRGEYATTVLYVQMALYIGLFGGLEVICRYAADRTVETIKLRRAAMWLGLTTGAITTGLVVLCNVIALPDEKAYLMSLGCLCAFSIIGQHVMLIMTAVDRGAGDFTKYNLRRFISAAAFPALLLVAAIVTDVTLNLACVLFVIASAISMAACVVGLPKIATGESEPPVNQLLKESRPYGVSMLATDLFERLDLLLVMWLVPLLTQGFYAAMVPVVYPLTVIPNTLGIYLFNTAADRSQRLQTSDVHRILGGSIAIQTVSTIAFMIVIGPLVRLVYGEEFAPAIVFAWWLAPVSAIKGILQGLDSYVKGRGKPLAPIRCRIVAAVVMLSLTAAFVGTYGAIAIAVAAFVGQIICLVWLSAIVYADVREQNLMAS